MRIGIDTGGTFTDFVVARDDGTLETFKLRSDPRDPASVIVEGLARIGAGRRDDVMHGSTVSTNALLERKGARTALVTTRGFEDVIQLGRQNRAQLYVLRVRRAGLDPVLDIRSLEPVVQTRLGDPELRSDRLLQTAGENTKRMVLGKGTADRVKSAAGKFLFLRDREDRLPIVGHQFRFEMIQTVKIIESLTVFAHPREEDA